METTLQHNMAREIGFIFIYRKGGTFEICYFCAQKSIIKTGKNKFQDLINAPRIKPVIPILTYKGMVLVVLVNGSVPLLSWDSTEFMSIGNLLSQVYCE